jgi:hypothetical protein
MKTATLNESFLSLTPQVEKKKKLLCPVLAHFVNLPLIQPTKEMKLI